MHFAVLRADTLLLVQHAIAGVYVWLEYKERTGRGIVCKPMPAACVPASPTYIGVCLSQTEAHARIWELETNLRLLEFMVDSAIASQAAPELSRGSAEPRVEPPASSVPSMQGSGDIEEFCAESGISHQGVSLEPNKDAAFSYWGCCRRAHRPAVYL